MNTTLTQSNYSLTQDQIEQYRTDGFIQLNDVVTGTELKRFRESVEHAVAEETKEDQRPASEKTAYEQLFIQKVNLWQRHPEVKEFVFSKKFANIAAQLSGCAVRLWHDQALFKEPKTGAKTPWHQDTHYWPHQHKKDQLSIWIALKDATIENGCMSFLPGTQKLDSVQAVNLSNPQDVFELAPELRNIKPRTVELKAGSCTFHNGLTFHFAGPNRTDSMREAIAILYMPSDTKYSGTNKHIVIEPGKFQVGDVLSGPNFPILSDVDLD